MSLNPISTRSARCPASTGTGTISSSHSADALSSARSSASASAWLSASSPSSPSLTFAFLVVFSDSYERENSVVRDRSVGLVASSQFHG